jgi:hypothetical protein
VRVTTVDGGAFCEKTCVRELVQKTRRHRASATASIGAMDKAIASGAIRIAASELGLGQLGFAFASVGAASSLLAPMGSGLPDHRCVGFSRRARRNVREIPRARTPINAQRRKLGKNRHAENVSFETLDTQIEHAKEKIAELTEGQVAGLELTMKHIGDGAVEMAGKMTTLFDAIGTQLEKEILLFDKVKDFLFTINTCGLLLPTQGELAKAFGADLAKTLDERGLAAGIEEVGRQIQVVNAKLVKTPGDKQLSEYADQLIEILVCSKGGKRLTTETKTSRERR